MSPHESTRVLRPPDLSPAVNCAVMRGSIALVVHTLDANPAHRVAILGVDVLRMLLRDFANGAPADALIALREAADFLDAATPNASAAPCAMAVCFLRDALKHLNPDGVACEA